MKYIIYTGFQAFRAFVHFWGSRRVGVYSYTIEEPGVGPAVHSGLLSGACDLFPSCHWCEQYGKYVEKMSTLKNTFYESNIRLQLCGLLRDACDLFPPRWQSRRTPLPIRSHSKTTLVSKITQEDQCAAMQFPNGHLLSSLESVNTSLC